MSESRIGKIWDVRVESADKGREMPAIRVEWIGTAVAYMHVIDKDEDVCILPMRIREVAKLREVLAEAEESLAKAVADPCEGCGRMTAAGCELSDCLLPSDREMASQGRCPFFKEAD